MLGCLYSSPAAQTAQDLNRAIFKGDTKAVKLILEKQPTLRGNTNYNPIAGALAHADLATLKCLLNNGVDPNKRYLGSSGDPTSPLIGLAMRSDGGLEAARLLDRYRVDWDQAGVGSMVFVASHPKHKPLLEFLSSKLSRTKKTEVEEMLRLAGKPKLARLFGR